MSKKNNQLKIKFVDEKKHRKDLYYYENKYDDIIVGGCDEAGRGPLAGPVVSAIVILPKNDKIEGINDSKKIAPRKRKQLFNEIIYRAVDWSIGVVNHNNIDKINILQATKLSIKLAYYNLKIKPDLLLIDALTIPDLQCRQFPIIKGDEKSVSIGAASIVAKVFRDDLMKYLSNKYPIYNFEKNKGYGTKEHINNIKQFGFSDIHRKSFKVKLS